MNENKYQTEAILERYFSFFERGLTELASLDEEMSIKLIAKCMISLQKRIDILHQKAELAENWNMGLISKDDYEIQKSRLY